MQVLGLPDVGLDMANVVELRVGWPGTASLVWAAGPA